MGDTSLMPFTLNRKYVFLILAVVNLAVYAPALFGDFIYDDHRQVEQNPWIRSVKNLPEIFKHSTAFFQNPENRRGPGNYYRPMHTAAYTLVYALCGNRPWGYHLANLILSILVSFMIYIIAKTWFSSWEAGLGALIFSVHPMHVEAVAWIAALPEMLSALLLLLVLKIHIKDLWKDYDYLVSGVCLLAAFLTRENALVLLLLVLLYDALNPQRGWSRMAGDLGRRYIVYILAAGVYFYLRYQVLGHFIADSRGYPLSPAGILLNIIPLLAQYYFSLLFPTPMSAFHVFHPVPAFFQLKIILSLGVLTGLGVLGWYLYKKDKILFFMFSWIPVTLLPFLYLPVLGENVFVERYMYLPSAGACILMGCGLLKIYHAITRRQVRWMYISLVIIIITGMAGTTFARTFHWRNDITLCTKTLKTDPGAFNFLNLLAYAYYTQGNAERAMEIFKSFDQYFPGEKEKAGKDGITYADVKKLPPEHNIYKQSYFEAQTKLAALHFQREEITEALELYKKLGAAFPGDYNLFFYLGLCHEKNQNLQEAARAYQYVLSLNPEHQPTRTRLEALGPGITPAGMDKLCAVAKQLADKKEYHQAIALLNQAAAQDTQNARPHHYLFNIYWLTKQPEKARQAIREALRRDPGNELFQFNYKALQGK